MPPPSVRSLVDRPGLGLVVAGGDVRQPDGSDRPVRWVAVSELEDPRPFLEGGELLLSTGMRLNADDPDGLSDFVDRLIEGGVAAFGLGVGLTHDTVPAGLLRAAANRGMVILEVPAATPFIAVTKAVSDMVAAQEYEATTRAFETQRDLTRAALGPEALPAVARRLAKVLGAWVLVLDPAGRVVSAEPGSAANHADRLSQEVELLRGKGLRSASALDIGGDRVALHPLGARGTVAGFVAVGRTAPLDRADASIVAVAVSLMSLATHREASDTTGAEQLRAASFRLALTGAAPVELPWEALGWGWLRQTPFRVVRMVVNADTYPAVRSAIEAALSRSGAGGGVVRLDEELIVLVVPSDSVIDDLADAVRACRAGGSGEVGLADLARGWQDAGHALDVSAASVRARGTGGGLVWHEALRDTGLRALVDPAAGRAFADALLAPLDATAGRADLLRSTRVWLAHLGQWDVAATELGVHRHTLRYRIRRVETLLCRSLDDPDLRAELWFALAQRPHDST